MPKKRIYRSKQDRMIAGVCGGIAEYFDWDPVWVRLGAVLLIFFHGIGLLMYIAAWIIMPENPNQKTPTTKTKTTKVKNATKTTKTTTQPPPKRHTGLITVGIIFGILLLVFAAGVVAQFVFCVNGSGTVVQETRTVQGFEEVVLEGSGTLKVTQGEEYSVVIETDDNLLQHYKTKVIGSKLEIGTEHFKCIRSTQGFTAYVTLPNITELTIAGSGDIIGENTITAEELELTVAGSGDIDLDVNVTQLETDIAGSGEARYTGKARSHEITIAGSGDIYAFELETKDTSVDIAGSGNAEVTATETLDIEIAGSGDISYYGSPSVSQSIAGSGDIMRME